MPRRMSLLALVLLLCQLACAACAKTPEITDLAEAAKDPDFAIQGEYLGQGNWQGDEKVKVGAQVVALGKGQFKVVLMRDGLPGDGWKRNQPRLMLTGERKAATTDLSGEGISGKIDGQTMTVTSADGKTNLRLDRTERHSPTEGIKAPEGAVVLFDGTTTDHFLNGTFSKDKNLLSEVTTKGKFGDFTLHLEFRLSYMPLARWQSRSNSGVYLHDCYETQVLDSFGLEGEDNECGGFYHLRKPDVNMCYPPLTWQTYDITFTAPRYRDGKKVANAKAEVRHNGVLIHPEFELPVATPGRQEEGPAPRPIYLQGHGNKVEYRNIWLQEKSVE